MPNVYCSPEKFGLEQVGELDEPDLSYEFHMLVVWRHMETGRLYYAVDSGCSCPSPFENCTELATLTPITQAGWASFENDVSNFPIGYPDRADLLGKIRGLLAE